MACSAKQLFSQGARASLTAALGKYPAGYDQVLTEVHQRLQDKGHATMLDLAGLVGWKHVQNAPWMYDLYVLAPGTVERATAAAFAPGLADVQRVSALHGIPGFGAGKAFTSVLLTAWDPESFGVFDKLANSVRPKVVVPKCVCVWEDLPTYFEHLRRLAVELSAVVGAQWTPRQVEMAMFILGGGK